MQYPFLIGESLRFGWHTMRAHSAVVFGVVLTLLALQVATLVLQKVLEGTALGSLAEVVLAVAAFVLSIGAARITLRLAQGHTVHYRDLLPPVAFLWPYFAASVLAGLCVLGGLILLILPGLWIAVRLSMTRFEILEGAGILESLKKSWALTHGHFWRLALFFVVVALVNIAGALLLMIGLLISIPVTMIAYAHVYQKLKAVHRPHYHS